MCAAHDLDASVEIPDVTAEHVFEHVAGGALLMRTGGVAESYALRAGSAFHLSFPERGTIRGRVLEYEAPRRIVLSWTVEGFGRPAEAGTRVCLCVLPASTPNAAALAIRHSGISSSESAAAKHRAWTEILGALAVSARASSPS
jgi:uncharacterized protein YndB with AHSA1/START domain